MPLNKMSKQHREILDIVTEMFPLTKIKVEHSIGYNLWLDIYIPRYSVAIEINGQQHYEFSPFFHCTQDKFELAKFLDKKKLMACREHNIGLYIIRYDEEFDMTNFYNFVLEHLQQVNNND